MALYEFWADLAGLLPDVHDLEILPGVGEMTNVER